MYHTSLLIILTREIGYGTVPNVGTHLHVHISFRLVGTVPSNMRFGWYMVRCSTTDIWY